MGAESEVALRLALKNRHETVAGLDDVGDELNRVGDQADRAGRKARLGAVGMLSFGKAGKLAGRAAVYGIGAASAGIVGAGIVLAKLSKDSIAEAREAQKVGAITRREIKATGGVANVTTRSVARLSGAISRKTGIDDEQIQTGANLVLTFKNIRNEVGEGNKVFDQATQAAVDLSAAGFGSIESASKMLGKALNDPTKGITAMSRAGVTFTQQQQDQIAAMVEQNDLLGAQKLILREVRGQVGGVAAAQATWGDKAKVAFGNIEESIGTALLPMLDDVERWFVQKGAPQLERWAGVFEKRGVPAIEHGVDVFRKKAVPAIGEFLDEARPLAKSVLPAIGTGLSTAADAFKVIAPKAKAVFDGFNNLPDWAKSAIAISAGAGVAAHKLGAGKLLFGGGTSSGGLLGGVSKSRPVPVIVMNDWGGGRPGSGTPPILGGPTGERGPGKPTGRFGKVGGLFGGLFGALLSEPVVPVGLDSAPGQASLLSKIFGGGKDQLPGTPVDIDAWAKQKAQLEAYRAELDQTAALFKTMPKSLQTDIVLHGAPEGRKEANDLAKAYHLTEGDRITLFRTSGIPLSQKMTAELLHLYQNTPQSLTTTARFESGLAEARIASYKAKLASIPGMESATARATGGPVTAGRPYIVGEKRPELFVPKVDGHILPRVPEMPRISDDDFADVAPGEAHYHFYIDGREMTDVVINRIRGKVARA